MSLFYEKKPPSRYFGKAAFIPGESRVMFYSGLFL